MLATKCCFPPHVGGREINSHSHSVAELLRTCKSVEHIKQSHALILKSQSNYDQLVFIFAKFKTKSMLEDFVSSRSNLLYAYSLVKHYYYYWDTPDLFILNAIVRGLSSMSLSSFDLFKLMLINGIVPDSHTVPFVLKSCSESRALQEGRQVHAHTIKTGLVANVYVKNTLMRFYAACGYLPSVQKVFDQGYIRDLVSWTTLIQGYLNLGYPREAIAAFFRMLENNMKNKHIGDFSIRPDQKTLVVVLSACSKLGDLELGENIHKYMRRHNFNIDSDVFLGNALVDMYLKCGRADLARSLFEDMPYKNVVSWNSMISGLVQQGLFQEALQVFHWMQTNAGLMPDNVTLVGVLNSCANLGLLDMGKWVHAFIDKHHIATEGIIANALVDMYGKCGSVEQAFKVFQAMKYKDVYSFSTIISVLAMHGEAERALQIFSEMSRLGILPDRVTFVGVLSACTHGGLVEQGWKHFEAMSKVYKLEPQMEHYGCLVDLLGRAGLVNEAKDLIDNMPISPDALIWGALLGACKIHGSVEIGESVVDKLVSIEPRRDGPYILMSNIYSSANRWRDASRWRKELGNRDANKVPGCSSIEVGGVIYEFRKGERFCTRRMEIYKLVKDMANHLRNYGVLEHEIV